MTYGDGLPSFGDSGGPLLIKTPNEGYKLAGIDNSIGISGMTDMHKAVIADYARAQVFEARISDYVAFLNNALPRMGASINDVFITPPVMPAPNVKSYFCREMKEFVKHLLEFVMY